MNRLLRRAAAGVPEPYRSRSWVAAVVGVLLVLAVGQWLVRHTPVRSDASSPYERAGRVGELVRLRAADLVVAGVDGAPAVAVGPRGLRSPGIVLVATVLVTPRTEAFRPGFAQVRAADGRTFDVGTSGRTGVLCALAPPGVTGECLVLAELPADAVAGARLALAGDFADQRFDDLALVDLGLTADDAGRWAARGEPLTRPGPTLVGAR